jgi:Domain of unknown function (DUF1841)
MTPASLYTREQLRQAYADAWRKRRAQAPLTALEASIADVIALHPEYHLLLDDPAAALAYEPSAEDGQENPFMHMGLHLAVREQLSIDRPAGVRDLYRRLQLRLADAHAAEHALMQALGEALWDAQRAGQAPDERQYLALARRRLDTPGKK